MASTTPAQRDLIAKISDQNKGEVIGKTPQGILVLMNTGKKAVITPEGKALTAVNGE